MERSRLILLTGASGYVGGRLLAALEAAGPRVRCLARHPEFLKPRVAPTTQVVKGDVLDPASLLVHARGSGNGFEEEDRRAAGNFAQAAREIGRDSSHGSISYAAFC